ncbi:DUF2156 domain-containing protein [Streptomyces actuosus]|uniref:DUF2156 domain-containing protein n=1 Tax=Streptomyces actuosus TaxID=1885 RepID=A0ABS2VWA1_STRAS|nr:phosphatidylglycerol lysyltransferase domain-containing protein [Streptomyces actuosus]MBN0047324.1 DUF2156 domain-containing protein [Streptomyces actuosus]
MGDARVASVPARRSGRTSRRAAGFAVRYLQIVAFVNFLGAVRVSPGQDVRRHNQQDCCTPYLLTAGFASGVLAAFLAVTMRRRKRAAWLLDLVPSGVFLALLAVAMAFPETRRHPQNRVSPAVTAAFAAALLAGRREFCAKGRRSDPRLAAAVAGGGLLASSLLAALLVTAIDRGTRPARFLDRPRYGALRPVSVAADEAGGARIAPPTWADVGVNTLRRAAEIEITQVSLNFAMFRSVFERGARLGAGPVLRPWRSLLGFSTRWWRIASLYRADAEYRPVWEPRFLLFEKSADLPRIGVASACAEGFLEVPDRSPRLNRTDLETRR